MLTLPGLFAKVLAENITGLSEVEERDSSDALKELSNVMCGLLLPMVASSPAEAFDVTVPGIRSLSGPSEAQEFIEQDVTSVFDIEGHTIAARLLIDG